MLCRSMDKVKKLNVKKGNKKFTVSFMRKLQSTSTRIKAQFVYCMRVITVRDTFGVRLTRNRLSGLAMR